MSPQQELESLTALFRNLGASSRQAQAMAAQTAKRADQLSRERGMERTEAMSYLLELVVKGRSGEAPASLSGQSDDEGQKPSNTDPT